MLRYRFADDVVSVSLGASPAIEVTRTFERGSDAFSGPLGPERVPNSLVLELQAMTGGHLLLRRFNEERLPMLMKVAECRFEAAAHAGVPLTSKASLQGIGGADDGPVVAETTGEVLAGGHRVATARLLFVCVPLGMLDRVEAWLPA
jgi:hypothetical protein